MHSFLLSHILLQNPTLIIIAAGKIIEKVKRERERKKKQ